MGQIDILVQYKYLYIFGGFMIVAVQCAKQSTIMDIQVHCTCLKIGIWSKNYVPIKFVGLCRNSPFLLIP